jgi:hypothetical protein
MPTVNLQFHACADELMELARAWSGRHELLVAVEESLPEYRAIRVPDGDPRAAGVDRADAICLSRREVDVVAATIQDFCRPEPGCAVRLDRSAVRAGRARVGGGRGDR